MSVFNLTNNVSLWTITGDTYKIATAQPDVSFTFTAYDGTLINNYDVKSNKSVAVTIALPCTLTVTYGGIAPHVSTDIASASTAPVIVINELTTPVRSNVLATFSYPGNTPAPVSYPAAMNTEFLTSSTQRSKTGPYTVIVTGYRNYSSSFSGGNPGNGYFLRFVNNFPLDDFYAIITFGSNVTLTTNLFDMYGSNRFLVPATSVCNFWMPQTTTQDKTNTYLPSIQITGVQNYAFSATFGFKSQQFINNMIIGNSGLPIGGLSYIAALYAGETKKNPPQHVFCIMSPDQLS